MSGSANLTVAGAVNQWNDMYTGVDNQAMFRFAVKVYKQMWQDTPVAHQFVQYSSGKDLLGFTPLMGPAGRTVSRCSDLLNQVRGQGAKKTTTTGPSSVPLPT